MALLWHVMLTRLPCTCPCCCSSMVCRHHRRSDWHMSCSWLLAAENCGSMQLRARGLQLSKPVQEWCWAAADPPLPLIPHRHPSHMPDAGTPCGSPLPTLWVRVPPVRRTPTTWACACRLTCWPTACAPTSTPAPARMSSRAAPRPCSSPHACSTRARAAGSWRHPAEAAAGQIAAQHRRRGATLL